MGFSRRTDHKTRYAIADRYKAGVTLTAIGGEFGLSPTTVRRTLIDMSIPLRPHAARGPNARHITDSRRAEIIDLYHSGKTLRQIEDIYGIPCPTVHKILKDAGATTRPAGRPRRPTESNSA